MSFWRFLALGLLDFRGSWALGSGLGFQGLMGFRGLGFKLQGSGL